MPIGFDRSDDITGADDTKIKGGTDGTVIGNTSNALNVHVVNGGGGVASSVIPYGDLMTGYQPDPSNAVDQVEAAKLQFDAVNRLETHGSVTTDETGFRDDFSGIALTSEWTATTTGTGTATVLSSIATLAPGLLLTGSSQIFREGDYAPMVLTGYLNISQRLSTQTAYFGFFDDIQSPTKQVCVVFDGTSTSTVKFRSSFSSAAADTQETTVTLPAGLLSSSYAYYNVSITSTQATLSINEIVVATHRLHIPGPYDNMGIGARIVNTAAVSATTLNIDSIYLNNWDRLQVDNDFLGEALLTKSYVDSTTTFSAVSRTELSQAASQGTAFSIISTTLTSNTTETRLLYLNNSSSNSKILFIANMLLAVDPSSANWCTFRVYYNPTITANGTALTISNMRAGASATSVMNAFTGPTASSNGTLLSIFPFNNSNQAGSAFPYNNNPYLIIPPGNRILITGTAKSNSTPVILNINWFEALS